MKKKMMASLLVGSAVVGASLAPLSAQATTTGNTPVQVEFGGGLLPDQDNPSGGSVDPDPSTPNTDFDLLAVPKSFNFPLAKIGEDLSALKESSSVVRAVKVGDVRGTKEGWHVTGEIAEMSNGTDKLAGDINFNLTGYYANYTTNAGLGYYEDTPTLNGMNIANDPTAPTFSGTSMKIGGGATPLASATVGKGQGTWSGRFGNVTLNVTTPYQQIKAGAYTGNITWNLVAGPSI
ncbi:WxL domain-containing protein [Enterococcus faecalis]|uniref:WxL domain-containing protein n=1 Tax=Enterococcus faecalis TaxID=1351 RepID=UPI00244D8468|nr:WxL domain-containing protein [Enterococcus faecalis]EJM6507236.1 WxL domain-containing protein [Enterococcus faecalis]MDK8108497.1 WxL domain-containing protein [Enterococcus faecalis]MED7681172.1 WxL domain-containing protein [Enterococcus faecalis]MED7688519.1 WxL domain-containing protein [Enterococcus faecalis]MED7690937.1 WxL domain-containing protein [Enterococcus faecalis]